MSDAAAQSFRVAHRCSMATGILVEPAAGDHRCRAARRQGGSGGRGHGVLAELSECVVRAAQQLARDRERCAVCAQALLDL